MIRISASDLESFRYFKANEESTLDDLIRRLAHKEPPTPQMAAGHAFAKLMEHAGERSLDVEEVDGWTFTFDLDAELALPPVRELKAEVLFDTPSGPVTLVGKCDALDGIVVRDQKLTERFDAERYTDSLQWRCYLEMFGARSFAYDVFVGRFDLDAKEVRIVEYHPLTLCAYPDLRLDVEAAVAELAEVVVTYGIGQQPPPVPVFEVHQARG